MTQLENIYHKVLVNPYAEPPAIPPAAEEHFASEAGAANTTASAVADAPLAGVTPGNPQQPSPFPPFTTPPSPATAKEPAFSKVDVENVLDKLASDSRQSLSWRTSIVDFLTLLEIDSSLQTRRELAEELHYSGNTEDTDAMNLWLHQQVMHKLAEQGGKVPRDLLY